MLNGAAGEAAAVAMRIVARSAAIEGAPRLLKVTQGHIDGCEYLKRASIVQWTARWPPVGERMHPFGWMDRWLDGSFGRVH